MDTTILQAFIQPEMAILVAALWAVGFAIKNMKKIKDEWIIFIVSAVGIIGACAIGKAINVNLIVQGIICAAVAVYGNQIVKQATKSAETTSK